MSTGSIVFACLAVIGFCATIVMLWRGLRALKRKALDAFDERVCKANEGNREVDRCRFKWIENRMLTSADPWLKAQTERVMDLTRRVEALENAKGHSK